MGKRSRAKRAARHGRQCSASSAVTSARQADTGLHAPTAAQVRAARRAQAQPRKRTYRTHPDGSLEPLNDALTGEPLQRGTFRLWMRDYDTARELYRGDPIPYALHSREMESGPGGGTSSRDYLGAHVLSRAALRYFAHAVVSASQAIDGQYAWWLDGYVVGRLTVRFGERVVMSAAAYERGQMDAREIARVYQVPVKRVIGWAHTVGRAARGYLREPRGHATATKVPAAAQVYREPTGSLMEYAESA